MTAIGAEIRQWLLEQPNWLQEAADRLLRKSTLSPTDVAVVCGMLKTPEGQAITKSRAFEMLEDQHKIGCELRLVSIGDVVGIEKLAPRRPLGFGAGNLTVVYGHNGSGKSGYTRILKRASGQPRASQLKSDVFQDAPVKRQCQIMFMLGDDEHSVEWEADGAPIDAIRSIDIFDTEEANHYLSKESAASYTPPLLSMFESLAIVCDRAKTVLQSEEDRLVSAIPTLPAIYIGTKADRVYGALRAGLTDAQVQQLVAWNLDSERELEELVERLRSNDPAALAKQRRTTKAHAERIAALLRRDMQSFGENGIKGVRLLQAHAQAKRRIAVEAAQVGSAKLGGVGSSTWRALWEAAKAYSQTVYPSRPFPVIDDARCVLCHQELRPDASHRLNEFEEFVQGRLEAEAAAAEESYRETLDAFSAAPSEEQVRAQCEAAGLVDEKLMALLVEFWGETDRARKSLFAGEVQEQALPVRDMTPTFERIREYCEELETQALQFEADAQNFDRGQVERSKLELEAQRWVSQQADAIRQEVERLTARKAFEDWKALTNPRKISLKAGEIAEKLITDAYVARFNAELQLLGATRIKVQLVKTRTERGRALHKVQLVGAKDGRSTPDLVLSEGERRVIYDAVFLAEVTDKPHATPFVFDDPISSLDQMWEERVIDRLISLSQSRQVIVFTHRLSILGFVAEKANSSNSLHIRSEPWGAGEVGEVPLYGKAPEKALNELKSRRLAQARAALNEGGRDVYYPMAKAICSDLRILIERFVEFVFLADVIQRHRRVVNTKGKIHDLLKIEKQDCDLIDEMMTKYSRFEHSQSFEAPVELPEPEELAADIDRLINWQSEFKKRPVGNCAIA